MHFSLPRLNGLGFLLAHTRSFATPGFLPPTSHTLAFTTTYPPHHHHDHRHHHHHHYQSHGSAGGFLGRGPGPARGLLRAATVSSVRTTTTSTTDSSSISWGGGDSDAGLVDLEVEVQAEETSFTFADGMTIAAKVWGPEDGIPVMGLHGWLDNAATFDRVGPHLAQAGVRLVAIDMPGHGKSSHMSQDAIYQIYDAMFYCICVADRLNWTTFSLLGHSLGAATASTMAGAFPDRIERTAVIEALGPLARPEDTAPAGLKEALQQRMTFLQYQKSGKKLARVYKGVDGAIKARLLTLKRLPGQQTLEEESARLLVLRGISKADEGGQGEVVEHDYTGSVTFRHDARLQSRSPLYPTEGQSRTFLQSIEGPVLLLLGETGWPYEHESMAARAAKVKNIQMKTVPGSHHLHLDSWSYRAIVPDLVTFFTAPPTTDGSAATASGPTVAPTTSLW